MSAPSVLVLPGRRDFLACKAIQCPVRCLEDMCCEVLARRVMYEDDPVVKQDILEALSSFELPIHLREQLITRLAQNRQLGSQEFDILIRCGVHSLSFLDCCLGGPGRLFRDDGLDSVWCMDGHHLVSLSLSQCEMHGAIYRMFISAFKSRPISLSSLMYLDVSGTDISDELLDLIYSIFPGLVSLNLSRCPQLSGVGSIGEAACAATLTKLDYSFNTDSMHGLSTLGSLTSLVDLCAVQVAWSDYAHKVGMEGAGALERVDITGCAALPPIEIITLIAPSMSRLIELCIAESCLASSDLLELSNSIPESASFVIATLDFSWCEHLDGSAISKFCARCPSLKNLQLQSTRVGVEDVVSVLTTCPLMRVLNLHRCDGIDGSVVVAAGRLHHLISLDVGWCNVDTESVLSLLTHSASIEVLSLRGCKALDAHLIAAVASPPLPFMPPVDTTTAASAVVTSGIMAPNLRFIDFNWVNMCSDALARSLSASRDNLLVTDYFSQAYLGGVLVSEDFY